MGPMLDIYLLTQQLEPFVQIGTRAAFFTLVNTIKLVLFLWSGMLSPQLLVLGAGLGAISVVGVLVSKPIVAMIPKKWFNRMQYWLTAYAGAIPTHTHLCPPRHAARVV